MATGRNGKPKDDPKMNDQEKSDGPVVPGKSPNKLRRRRRAHGHGESYAGTKAETPDTAK
jgi:hypothetical protein